MVNELKNKTKKTLKDKMYLLINYFEMKNQGACTAAADTLELKSN